MTPIGVNVTCNSNCNKWCPRVLEVVCCCFTCTSDNEQEENEETEKVKQVANPIIAEVGKLDQSID